MNIPFVIVPRRSVIVRDTRVIVKDLLAEEKQGIGRTVGGTSGRMTT